MTPTQQELRELDAWIAVNVFSWTEGTASGDDRKCFWPSDCDTEKKRKRWIYGIAVPNYSTDPAAAFEVLRKCCEKRSVAILYSGHSKELNFYQIDLVGGRLFSQSETLELAIAKFAQKLFSK